MVGGLNGYRCAYRSTSSKGTHSVPTSALRLHTQLPYSTLPTMHNLADLRKISDTLLEETADPAQLLGACQDFFALGEAITAIGEQGGDVEQLSDTTLPGGVAVSPLTAARCSRELARTSRFVRGLYAALLEAQRRFPGQTIHTLYAGCGPYATLILPLLLRLPRGAFRFTLVDIHALALDSARKLISHFGFDDFIADYRLTDAVTGDFSAQRPIHVAVTETMQRAMDKEPQLAVCANVVRYLEPDGILVPERITVSVALVDPGREHNILPADYSGEPPPLRRRRRVLGTIMTLDQAMAQTLGGHSAAHLPPVSVPWPAKAERENLRPVLLTHIQVFGEHDLACYDCSLTLPKPLRPPDMPEAAADWVFTYRLGNRPGFDCCFV